MPKRLKDIRCTILEEAKKQVLESGYSTMTIRSVVKACNISIGTMYNYFSSKDELVASFLLDDWLKSLAAMQTVCENTKNNISGNPFQQNMINENKGDLSQNVIFPRTAIHAVYRELITFSQKYSMIFHDSNAQENAIPQIWNRHSQLRSQIAAVISPVCQATAKDYTPFFTQFIADSLITWSVENREFNEIWSVLSLLFSDTPV